MFTNNSKSIIHYPGIEHKYVRSANTHKHGYYAHVLKRERIFSPIYMCLTPTGQTRPVSLYASGSLLYANRSRALVVVVVVRAFVYFRMY